MTFTTKSMGRNVLVIQDLGGKATTDANETDLIPAPGSAGFWPLGEFSGGSAVVTIVPDANAGTARCYGSLDQTKANKAQIGADQAIGASTPAIFQISKLGEFFSMTIQRTSGNMTVKWKAVITKPCGTM